MQVFVININNIKESGEALIEKRLPLRFARAGRFKFRSDYLRSIGASLLLLKALGSRSESDISYGEHGQPIIPGICFNLSHSGDFAVLAISDRKIGIDIEHIDPRHIDVASHVYTDEEISWMNENPEERFFTLWCQKESVMKATGRGLTLPPKSFTVMPFQKGEPISVDGLTLYNATETLGDCMLSVSSENPISEINFEEIY